MAEMRASRSRATSRGISPRRTVSCRADNVCERKSVGARSLWSAGTSILSLARRRTTPQSTTNLIGSSTLSHGCGAGCGETDRIRVMSDEAASAKITERIRELGDWRGETLAQVRRLIRAADPDLQEEWKWEKPKSGGTPVWSHDGGICTGEAYKQVVKLTFFRGASIEDPKKLFNSSLEGNTRRAIDLREGEQIDEPAFKQLIRAAVAANSAQRAGRAAKRK